MTKERVAITDAGGRGEALKSAYLRSADVVMAPGTDHSQHLNRVSGKTIDRIRIKLTDDPQKIASALADFRPTLVDVCQDDAAAGGLVDVLQSMGIPAVGPTKAAARLEYDKPYAREFMARYNLPHPEFHVFHSTEDGIAFVRSQPDRPWVIKAAGLAAGKGVIVTDNAAEAEQAIIAMKSFGPAGGTYLIEECLKGEEFSAFAISDGKDWQMLGTAQDNKRLLDGNKGPNTGGMGCHSSPLAITPNIARQIGTIFDGTFEGMRAERAPYTGVLYLGGMIVDGKVSIIEFNARWGDPETQVIAPGITTDFLEIGRAVVEKRIGNLRIATDGQVRVTVAVVSKGYPVDHSAVKGKRIYGIDHAASAGVTIFPAGMRLSGGTETERGHDLIEGGRLLYGTAAGRDVRPARAKVYDALKWISADDKSTHFRTDVGLGDARRLNGAA